MNGFLSRLVGAGDSGSKVEPRLATAFESPAVVAFGQFQTVYDHKESGPSAAIPGGPDADKKTTRPVTENNFSKAEHEKEVPVQEFNKNLKIPEITESTSIPDLKITGTNTQQSLKNNEHVEAIFVLNELEKEPEKTEEWDPVENNSRLNVLELNKEQSTSFGAYDEHGMFVNSINSQQTITELSLNNTFNTLTPSGFLSERNNNLNTHSNSQPVVKINIGRIDIKAVTQSTPLRETKKQSPGISLDELLKKKNKH